MSGTNTYTWFQPDSKAAQPSSREDYQYLGSWADQANSVAAAGQGVNGQAPETGAINATAEGQRQAPIIINNNHNNHQTDNSDPWTPFRIRRQHQPGP